MIPGAFAPWYTELLETTMFMGVTEVNKRTGVQIKVYPYGGVSGIFSLKQPYNLPITRLRKLYPASAAAELMWFLKGSKDITWFREYSTFWNKFVEADGKTVANAYGYRWRAHFGRDQIEKVITSLRDDTTSRQVVVCAWDPAIDGLGNTAKNVPCPAMFNFVIINGQLCSSLFIRSSDIVLGLPYDIMGHALLTGLIARELNVSFGTLHVTLGHAHIYERHYDAVSKMLNQYSMSEFGQYTSGPMLPPHTLMEACACPDEYIFYMSELAKEWSALKPATFSPKLDIVV